MAEDSFIDGLTPGGGLQIGDKIPVTRGEGEAAEDFYVTFAPETLTSAQLTDHLVLRRGGVFYQILVSDFMKLLNPSPGAILMEDGGYILQEDGSKILLEG